MEGWLRLSHFVSSASGTEDHGWEQQRRRMMDETTRRSCDWCYLLVSGAEK